MARRGALAWVLAVLAVAWLHVLSLAQLAHMLPGLASSASAPDTRAFTTRTVRIDNAAPQAATTGFAPPPAATRTQKAPSRTVPQAAAPPGITQTEAAIAATESGPGLTPALPEPTALAPGPAPSTEAEAPQPAAGAATASASSSSSASAPAAASAASPPSPDKGGGAPPVYDYLVPGSTRLKYEVSGRVKGFGYHVSGELLWLHDGKTYDARLEISHFLLGSRVQSSKGTIAATGLEPLRFGDKVRSEVAAHFERAKGKVSFSANTPDVALLSLAQDQLSIFVQLAAMWGGNATRFVPGMQLPFQAVGPRSAEDWVFVVGPTERLKVEGRDLVAVKLLRERSADYDVRVELWLAPALDYLPARIRLTQSNGDEVDMLWRSTEKP